MQNLDIFVSYGRQSLKNKEEYLFFGLPIVSNNVVAVQWV